MRNQIEEVVVRLGLYYDKKLSPEQIEMYTDDLMVLTPAELIHAIRVYRTDPANSWFPLPGKLIGIIRPPVSNTDEANEVAGLIITAISKAGHNNIEKAKQIMGALGWEVVQRFGGWKSICETENDNIGTLRAQLRGLVETVSKRAKRGELHQKPGLPEATDISKLITNTMKGIESNE